MTTSPPVDPRALRSALGSFTTGVTIVTTTEGSHDAGVTVNSFNSVSLEPPMVLWSLAKSSGSFDTFHNAEYFAVHILAADQEELSKRFATRGIDKFAGVDFARGVGNVPILAGCTSVFHCRTVYRYEGGDHEIYVGHVERFEHYDRPGLVFQGGKYALAVQKQPAPAADGSRAAAGGFSANSLTYLMGLVYFQLASQAAAERARRGISEEEMGVLSMLGMQDNRSAAEIDQIVRVTGMRVDDEVLHRMAAKHLVTLSTAGELRAHLTESGQQLLVEQVAYVQAIENAALPADTYAEVAIAKELLKNTAVKMLKARGEG